MIKTIYIYLTAFIIILVFSACPDVQVKDKQYKFEKEAGFFITNEGIFQQANASVSYFDWKQDSLYENIFENANGEKIGDILQNMNIFKGKAYLVVNNSAWIDVVDIESFEKRGEIRGFVSPRFFQPVSKEKAYVTDLYSGYIYVVDLNRNIVSKKIFTGKWTEKIALSGNKLYVSCPWVYSKPVSKKILVLNTDTDEIIDSISAGINPSDLGIDKNGFLWTLNNGNTIKNIPGSLYKINLETKSVVDSFIFDKTLSIFNSSLRFNENRDSIYILYNDVYSLSVEGDITPEKIVSGESRNLYGMDPDNKNELIFLTDAQNFAEKGKVFIYTKKGELIKTLNAGYLPNSIVIY